MDSKTGNNLPKETAREVAVTVARTLINGGHIAYFAGGCVRDRIMGFEPKDYDIATDAHPEKVMKLFRGSISVGEAFGVVLVRRDGRTMEIATFRTDGKYSDRRHPDEVTFTDAEHDARRRDFTMNGLFEHPLTGEIIDYVDGQADIEAELVRAIGNPAARLGEDHLRMLRAIRFASRFHFTIEAATAEAISKGAVELRGISRERIGLEVKMMLTDPNRCVAAWELQYLGLDSVVLEEEHLTVAPRRMGRLPEDAEYPTVLAAWLLDRHGGRGTDPAETAQRWSKVLMLSNAERTALSRTLDINRVLHESWFGLGVAGQKRLAASPHFEPGLLLLQAEDTQAFVDVRRRVSELAETGLAPAPLVTGDDLISAGYSPGPWFKGVLDAVYDAQLEGAIHSREEGLELARIVRDESDGQEAEG